MKQREFLSNLVPSLHDVFGRIFQALDKYDLTDYLTPNDIWCIEHWCVVSHRWNNLVLFIGIFERLLHHAPIIVEWLIRDVDKYTFNAMMSFVIIFEHTKKHLITNL